jgi:phosphoribosylformylglycinamidine cyclo-ligase
MGVGRVVQSEVDSCAMKSGKYAAAGVDIDLGNRVKSTLPGLLASTRRPGVLGRVGGFGGLFALGAAKYRKPVLVSSVDGVGTKLKVAFAMGRHDTVGQDLVNHCVNDIAVLGAEALFFLDYLGTGRLEAGVFTEIVRGFARACAENKCALIGGETAQMPGFYRAGEYDVSGTIVGVVERSRILDGSRSVRPGDVVVGLASSGLHTNGYSLARKILFGRMKLRVTSRVAELGVTVGEELLKVHVSYGRATQALLRRFNADAVPRERAVRALAHITGGGFYDNIPRVMPRGCDVILRRGSWEVPAIFRLLQGGGRVEEEEMYRVFNMGVGMVVVVAPERAGAVLRFLEVRGHRGWVIGEVTRGAGRVRLVGTERSEKASAPGVDV